MPVGTLINDLTRASTAGALRGWSTSECKSGIYMLGAFPPPVHGMSTINAEMLERLCSRGIAPVVLDLAAASLERSWFNRFARVRKVGKALLQYARQLLKQREGTLYVGLSGGWGQLYEILFIALARLRGHKIFLHHHSCAYLERRNLLTQCMFRVAGQSATHIVLCEGQERRLRQCYPTACRTRVVSNAAVMEGSIGAKSRTRVRLESVGFLGNISLAKGVHETLTIAERLEREQAGLQMYIAGPFENKQVEDMVKERLAMLRRTTYLGPRYGAEKESFWCLVDVLLFPSRYSNETAPLVVYEAMAHGVPVIAWERGCLSDMVRPSAGLLISQDQDFVASALEQLARWRRNPATFGESSENATKGFIAQREKYAANLENLLDELSAAPAGVSLTSVKAS